MYALTHGRTGVLHLPRPTRRSSGLRGLSRRFWASFVLGSVLVMLDSFETMAALAWSPVPGHPGLVVRHASELNPIGSALAAASPWLLPVFHLVEIGIFLAMCWILTRDAVVRHMARRRPSRLLVRLGAPRGEAWVRLLLWLIPLAMVLTEGLIDLNNALVLTGGRVW